MGSYYILYHDIIYDVFAEWRANILMRKFHFLLIKYNTVLLAIKIMDSIFRFKLIPFQAQENFVGSAFLNIILAFYMLVGKCLDPFWVLKIVLASSS